MAAAAVAALLGFELLPAPRKLYAADCRACSSAWSSTETRRVLELPTRVRDGLSSLDDFNAISQFIRRWMGRD